MTSKAASRLSFAISVVGICIWAYGYLTTGHPRFVNWDGWPWWIADFMPNVESEIGMGLLLASMIPGVLSLRPS